MDHGRVVRNGILTCLFSSVAMLSVPTASGADMDAKIIHVKGSARYSTGNNVWQPATVGTYLPAGSVIQTSTDNSYVDVALTVTSVGVSPNPVSFKPFIPSSHATAYMPMAADNVVRIWENTALGIDKMTRDDTGTGPVTETLLDLKQGRISGVAKKISAASKYEIKLPNGVASVRGTVFELQAVGVVKVFNGSVMMAWVPQPGASVVTQMVVSGQKYDARTGEIKPLAPEDNAGLDRLSTDLVAFEFNAPTGIAADQTFNSLSPVAGD
jgi:hypothetical protein